MKNDTLAKLKAHMESPEGQEHMKQFVARLKDEQNRLDARVEAIHIKYKDKIDAVMERLITKYESDKYRDKEYKLGYEPREDLYWVMLRYAEKHCIECKDPKYWNMFTGGCYYIGSYVIQVMHGQGSVIRIDKQY